MGFSSIFGGGTPSEGEATDGFTGTTNGEEYVDGYKVATAEDMEWFAKLL